MILRTIIVLIALVLVAGCRVNHQQDVDTYRQLLNANTPEPQIPPGGPLTLQNALAQANRANESLAVEGEGYVRAILQKRRAVAAFFPTVDLSPTLNVREPANGGTSGGGTVIVPPGGGTGGSTGGGGGSDWADFDVPVEAQLVVFNGQRNINGYWRDVYLIQRQRERLFEAQESLLYDVANVFYTALRAEAQAAVLRRSLGVQQERLRDARGRAEAGTARPLDVSQTEAQYAATRVTLIEAERQVDDARSLLSYLLDRRVQDLPFTDDFTPGDAVPPVDALFDTARYHRSELAAAERAIAAAQRDVQVAIGQYYPEVTINFSTFLYRESVPDERTWQGLLQVNFPIFRAGSIDADVREAWSFLREAQLVETQTRRRITREVEQAVRDLSASRERLAQLDIQLRAAAEAFRQADAAYQAGRATNLERVVAQDQQLQAELALATEQIDQKLVRINILRTVGTLRETLLTAVPTTGPASD